MQVRSKWSHNYTYGTWVLISIIDHSFHYIQFCTETKRKHQHCSLLLNKCNSNMNPSNLNTPFICVFLGTGFPLKVLCIYVIKKTMYG
jgi:hypothetical protein